MQVINVGSCVEDLQISILYLLNCSSDQKEAYEP